MAIMKDQAFKSAPVDCIKCELHLNRTQIVYPDVFSNSSDNITILVIGEAPGAKEDEQGKPFVGSSGKLLRKELQKLPGRIVITNTVKCRPPENRNPKSSEKKACYEHLTAEVEYYKPDLILLVGRISSSLYLDVETLKNFTEKSGTIFNEKFIPILHPASTMYNGKKNRPIWEESWKKILTLIKIKFPAIPETSFSIASSSPSKSKSVKTSGSLDKYL